MADQDEYQFSDPNIAQDATVSAQEIPASDTSSAAPAFKTTHPQMKRNALIALGVFFLVMVLYSIITKITKQHDTQHHEMPGAGSATNMPAMTPPVVTKVEPEPVATSNAPTENSPSSNPTDVMNEASPENTSNTMNSTAVTEALSVVEQNQDLIKTDVLSMHEKVSSMSSQVDLVRGQLMDLNKKILELTQQMHEETYRMEKILKEERAKKAAMKKKAAPPVVYYIQAVIPGRAWLITTTGTPKTVRVGTSVPGYGVVQHIDAKQGVILTSSGRAIRFSQDDS